MPPPNPTLHRRRGYRAVDSSAAEDAPESVEVPPLTEEAEHDDREREVVEHEGWYDLAWSFGAAGGLTVSLTYLFYLPY